MKVKNPVSQNIRIFAKINQKNGFVNQKSSSSLKCVDLCTQHLVGAALAQTPASVKCGMEAISLWLVCIVGSTVYHFSLENIP